MGSKQTKFEGEYLPDTPQLKKLSRHQQLYKLNGLADKVFTEMDPRSPGVLRTPVATLHLTSRIAGQQQSETPANFTENTFGNLRKRIFKGFTYNLNDPRSPALNRTPLPFEDGKDKTLNLDDTFADLFVESRAPPEVEVEAPGYDEEMCDDAVDSGEQPVADTASTDSLHNFTEDSLVDVDLSHDPAYNTSVEVISMPYEDEETMPCPDKLQQTPVIEYPVKPPTQTKWDPRSPTIGIDRTPVLLDHDDSEEFEDAMLETVLATLSLDVSATSSMASFASAIDEPVVEVKPPTKPDNKHLSRVRGGGGIRKRQRQPRHKVFEDAENTTPVKTPKQNTVTNSPATKRTPLSCVKNRAHLRSRSVEPLDKVTKNRITLQSFDDQLNPQQSVKVARLHILQGSQDCLLDL